MTLIEFLRLPLEEKIKGVWLSGTEGEGEYIKCWNNGLVCEHYYYKNGEPHGECKWWHNGGQLWYHTRYKDGKRHGEYKAWDRDGELYIHSLFENGTIIKDYLK